MIIILFITLITAYLLGSVSSAIIICKLMGLPDPRENGSGNPGATNVLRLAGKKEAAIVLVSDALKGLLAVMIGRLLGLDNLYLSFVALAAFLGHLYPVFFQFKGGKGVATAFGGLLGLAWPLFLIPGLVWLSLMALFRYSSLAAIGSAIIAPIVTLWINPGFFLPIGIMSGLLIWRHYDNISRLLEGVENKVN